MTATNGMQTEMQSLSAGDSPNGSANGGAAEKSGMNYFGHYSKMNDLSLRGRRANWNYYRRVWSRLLPGSKDARILDVGCGAGLLMEWLVRGAGYAHVFGIDIDPGQVAFAQGLGLNSELVDDAGSWIDRQSRFNLILITDVSSTCLKKYPAAF